MRRSIKAVATTSVLVASLAAASALYAHDSQESGGAMMGPGMMGQGGMMGMMGQMSQMMESCTKMMQSMHRGGSGRPNEQWRKETPVPEETPGRDG